MCQQIKFAVVNPNIIINHKDEETIFGGIAIFNNYGTITNVICGCCGNMLNLEDIEILERYNTWISLSGSIMGDWN